MEHFGLIKQYLLSGDFTKVLLAGCDIDGIARGKIVSIDKAVKSLEGGFGYCSVLFEWDRHDKLYTTNNPTAPIAGVGFGDILAKIDLTTWRPSYPSIPKTPFMIVDFHDPSTGLPLAICPRGQLKRILDDLANVCKMKSLAGMEFEWFNFNGRLISNPQKRPSLSPRKEGLAWIP
jgi:glutamine synthetase